MRKSYLVYSRIKFGSGNGLVPAKFWERAKQFIVMEGNWGTPSHGIRGLIQRRRRRQRERQKTNRFRLEKQQLCTCIKLFVHFFAVVARLQLESGLISRFVEAAGTQDNNFDFLFLNLNTIL